MSIIGLSMAALPCCAKEDVEAGSAALRVDWPVYPRRAEHNTVAEGGNRRWAETTGLLWASLWEVLDPPSLPTAVKAANAGGAYPDVRADPWPTNRSWRGGRFSPRPQKGKLSAPSNRA